MKNRNTIRNAFKVGIEGEISGEATNTTVIKAPDGHPLMKECIQ